MTPATDSPVRDLLSRCFLAVAGFFALVMASAAMSSRLLPGVPRNDATHVLAVVMLLAGAALAAKASPAARDFIGLQWRLAIGSRRVLGLAVLAGLAFYVLAFTLGGTDPARIRGWHVDLRFVVSFLLLSALLQSLVEESFFRAIAIGRARGGPALASAALSGAAFAAIHPDRWLSVFVFSLVAAAFYLRAGLFGAHAFHASYNLANYAALAWFSAR